MKYAVWLSLVVLCSMILLFAQDQGTKMAGTICNSQCVVQQSNLPTCDPSCTNKTGDAVFVSDSGKVMKIANQQMAMPRMGKHVTMMAAPTEQEREQSIRIMEFYEQAP